MNHGRRKGRIEGEGGKYAHLQLGNEILDLGVQLQLSLSLLFLPFLLYNL